jgi:hypothetical protein
MIVVTTASASSSSENVSAHLTVPLVEDPASGSTVRVNLFQIQSCL